MAPLFKEPNTLYQRDTIALPAKLQQIIPTCAQQCTSSAIASSFVPDKCKSAIDVSCLCSHYSTSGYALSELALACVYSDCSESVRDASSQDVFGLCSSYTKAVTATHLVLTLTKSGADPSTSSSSKSSTSSSSARVTESTLLSSISTRQLTEAASTVTSVSTPSATLPISETSAPPSSVPTQSPKGLTTGQAVGVSVASIAIAALLFGICFFCCCCVQRRRKQNKGGDRTKLWIKSQNRLDFQDRSSPTGSKFHSHTISGSSITSPKGPVRPPRSSQLSPTKSQNPSLAGFIKRSNAQYKRRYDPSSQEQRQWWRNTFRPEVRQVPDGIKSQHGSISSPNHYLRPEDQKKRSSRIPTPNTSVSFMLRKASRHLRPDSTATKYTMFEEDVRPPLPPKPVLCTSSIYPPESPLFTDQYTTSPEELTKSGLMLQIPRKPILHNEPNTVSLDTGISRTDHLSMPPSSAASYLPAYYTSNLSRTPVAPHWSPGSTHERFSQPQFVPRPLAAKPRHSWASATTFESVDPEEVTPENEEDRQLPRSPVAYPKVPRPSNQAVPRSSPASVASSAGQRSVTLAAKRRGEDLSLDLGRRLMISGVEGGESPLKGYGRRKATKTPQMEMGLKSPLWEPKLTPSRRGDDLFLSVEVKGR